MKYTYAVMSNALVAAQADYGDPTGWEWGTGVTKENNARVVQTYISPYINKTEEWSCEGHRGYCMRLKNGITIVFTLDGTWDTTTEEGYKDAVVSTIYILASLKNKQSELQDKGRDYSRDDFVLRYSSGNKNLHFFNWGGNTREGIKNTSKYACNKNIAKNRRLNCGALIYRDNWEIKDDYPW